MRAAAVHVVYTTQCIHQFVDLALLIQKNTTFTLLNAKANVFWPLKVDFRPVLADDLAINGAYDSIEALYRRPISFTSHNVRIYL